jgi:hypothetical protein
MFYIVSSRDTITNSFINTLCMLTFIEREKNEAKNRAFKMWSFFDGRGLICKKGWKGKKNGGGGSCKLEQKVEPRHFNCSPRVTDINPTLRRFLPTIKSDEEEKDCDGERSSDECREKWHRLKRSKHRKTVSIQRQRTKG